MEVSALTTNSYTAASLAETRAPVQSQRQAVSAVVLTQADVVTQTASEASGSAQSRAESVKAESQVNAQRAQAQERATALNAEDRPAVGRIRFEIDDGTNVTKFFDTKDVLIYQVPPEGNIYLVRAQEAASQDQVETSA